MMDPDLERAIDNAGRDEVFALMLASGWPAGSAPPKWVWYEACEIVQYKRKAREHMALNLWPVAGNA